MPITVTDKLNPEQFEIINANTIKNNDNVPNKDHGLIKDKEGQISQKVLDKDTIADNTYKTRQDKTRQGLSMLVLSSARYCNGVIGTPITFLDKRSPEQFRIKGLDRYIHDNPRYGHRFRINDRETYARILVQKIL